MTETRPKNTVYVYSEDWLELHSIGCLDGNAQINFEVERFKRKYPNYCRKCGATGYITYQDDPSPAGVGLSPGSMEFTDPCPECLDKGLCPRCGQPVPDGYWQIEDDDRPCGRCGFVYDEEAIPLPKPECYCWENYADYWIHITSDDPIVERG